MLLRRSDGSLRPVMRARAYFHRKFCLTLVFLAGFGGLASSGCQQDQGREQTEEQTSDPSGAPPAEKSATADKEASPPVEAIVHVPVGSFQAGSRPGEKGRDPRRERELHEQKLGPFRIDAYPQPGPGKPPRLGISHQDATAICATQGGRLCTELEWERACKGPGSTVYPTGATPCTDGTCQSGFDVRKMGLIPEWTANRFGKEVEHAGEPVVRGAPAAAKPETARCARRQAAGQIEEEVGFRCCYGAPNAAKLAEPELGKPYEEVEVDVKQVAEWLRQDERTAHLAKDLKLFKPEAARTVFDRGPGDTMGFTLTENAVRWRPERGTHYLVVVGASGETTAFVVAYHVVGDEKILAGSFIMKNERGPIALGYAPSIRPRMHFSSCWGCPGETGKLLFRPPNNLVLLQP